MDESLYHRGVDLFNAGEYYDAHEVLEDAWRASKGEERIFLQALVQLAVGLHHYSTGNVTGAVSLLQKSETKLAGFPEGYGGIRLLPLTQDVKACLQELKAGRPLGERPRIERTAAAADARIKTSPRP